MASSLEDSNPGSPTADGIPKSAASASPKLSSPAPPPPPVVEPPPRQIEDFDALINKEVKNFVELSKKLGEPAVEQVYWYCMRVYMNHGVNIGNTV